MERYRDDYADYEPDPPEPGWCEEHGEIDDPETGDAGIGPYEFWGCKGWDSRPYAACPICESALYDHPAGPICEQCEERYVLGACPACGGDGVAS